MAKAVVPNRGKAASRRTKMLFRNGEKGGYVKRYSTTCQQGPGCQGFRAYWTEGAVLTLLRSGNKHSMCGRVFRLLQIAEAILHQHAVGSAARDTSRFADEPVTQLHANLDQPAHGQHRADDATNQVHVEREHSDHPRIVWILPLQLSAPSAQVIHTVRWVGLLH